MHYRFRILIVVLITIFFCGPLHAKKNENVLNLSLIKRVGIVDLYYGEKVIRPNHNDQIILSSKIDELDLSKFHYFTVKYDLYKNIQDAYLFFRIKGKDQMTTNQLPINANNLIYKLNTNEKIEKITEVGVILYGDDTSQVSNLSLSLLPYSIKNDILSELSQWYSVFLWDQTTINYINIPYNKYKMPTAVAVLVIVAIIIFSIFKINIYNSIFSAVVIGWVVMDTQWYNNQIQQIIALDAQVKNTVEGKVLKIDSELYEYITDLKEKYLPVNIARIQIIKDSEDNDYYRLKAKYYLLPHAVNNRGRYPSWERLHTNDWLLIIGEKTKNLIYRDGRLVSGSNSIKAELIHHSEIGTLFKII